MRSIAITVGLLLAGWILTGCFVVRGDEQAVIRRFGRLQAEVRGGGWHFDLPWPFVRVDRVKVHEVRTLEIGLPGGRTTSDAEPLLALFRDRQAEFLTADKNIINVQVQLQYTIADPALFVLSTTEAESALHVLVESLVTDAIALRGVDEIQPSGLTELRETLLRRVRNATETRQLGVNVEDVAIGGVFPPLEVKEAFLDVSNARAEKERGIQEEQTLAEQRLTQSRASASELLERAGSAKHQRVTAAQGEADRFTRMVNQLRLEATNSAMPYAEVRQLAVQRLFAATLEDLLPKLAGKIVVDGQQPADLTLFPQKPSAPTSKPTEDKMP